VPQRPLRPPRFKIFDKPAPEARAQAPRADSARKDGKARARVHGRQGAAGAVPPRLRTISEFELIRRFFTHAAPRTALAVGDDAALVRVRAGLELAISVDMLVAGRHFLPDADARLLGHKALAVNLSDMAAMGATPCWATLAVSLPEVDAHWLRKFSRGFMRLARAHDVDLVGGDTTRGPLTISVQIIGTVPAGEALRRDGARPGDDIWVSGTLGEAALALAVRAGSLRVSARERAALERRLDAPVPRVGLGLALRGVAHSAIDISDGLVADLGHICERSRVGALIDWESVPVAATLRARAHLEPVVRAFLCGGDDYELCFTAPPSRRAAVQRAARRAGVAVTRIGSIVTAKRGASAVRVVDSAGAALEIALKGYDHFA
jgi:thiamine-monophosphate kinase